MKTVLAFGSFDILHFGHLKFLESAKKLGNRLVVVVARDETMKNIKGREPVFDENARLEMIKSLKVVDKAMLGSKGGRKKYDLIKRLKPQVIALGYDQVQSEQELRVWLDSNGLKAVKIVRIRHVENEEVFKSTKAIGKIRSCIVKEL